MSSLPHPVREIENLWIPLSDGTRIAARLWQRALEFHGGVQSTSKSPIALGSEVSAVVAPMLVYTAQITMAVTAAPPISQAGLAKNAASAGGAAGPGASSGAGAASGGGAGAGATVVAPPDDAAPPDVPAPPLPCAKALPVAVKSNAPPARIDTHFRCMARLPLENRRNGSLYPSFR